MSLSLNETRESKGLGAIGGGEGAASENILRPEVEERPGP